MNAPDPIDLTRAQGGVPPQSARDAGAAGEPARPEWWRRRPYQIAGGIVLLIVLGFLWLTWALPLGRSLAPLETPTVVLITADGKPFARRGSYKEAPVDAARLPAHVPAAFVAIEDRRFYRHIGLDPQAIGRALVRDVKSGAVREGGSTITQQLAKNAFLSNERSLRRKAQEAIIALYLEARLSKNDILSRYLSSVYFGDGVFGLRAAARHYFDKTPEQLSVGEAAMLAGIVKAPTRLAPTEDFEAAKTRAAVVLGAMADQGMITEKQARQALAAVKVKEGRQALPVGSYFADWISPQVKQAFNRAYGEVEVYTTLDSQMQIKAQQAVARAMAGAGRVGASQAALVAMRTDGRVVALVGGTDYKKSQYNRATQAERQPGSAFKLFVYLAALRQGMTPDSLVLDAPVTIGNWRPENHEGHYAGRPVPLKDAFARSSNVAAARLVQQVGVNRVIAAARDLGIEGDLPNDATIALGTGTVSLMDLTSAYAGVAAGQAPIAPRGVLNLKPESQARPLNKRDQEGLLTMLRETVARGTGTAANLSPDVRGKTGTSQDYRDAWFVGFAGDLVVGVWVGNDDNSPMKGVTGGSLPAQIWRDFMGYAMRRPDFPKPAPREETRELFDFSDLETQPLEVPALEGEPAATEDGTLPPDTPVSSPGALIVPPVNGPTPAPAPNGPPVQPAPLAPPPPVRPEPLQPPAPTDEPPSPGEGSVGAA